MAQQQTDVVALQLEKVHDALVPLFERAGTTFQLIKEKGGVEKVSYRAMRIPIELVPPGKFRQVDLDGGDLGRGSGTAYTVATISPIDFVVALETTKKVAMTTDSTEKAIANAVRRDVKNGVKEMRWGLDCLVQGAGTGQIATAGTIAGTTWTLSSAFTTQLIHRGQTVNLYDSTFATKRVGNAVVTAVNYAAGTIVVDALPTGGVSGDLVVIEGLSGASPVSMYGISYHQSDATTGLWLTLDKALNPELRTPSVNASSNGLTPTQVRLALNLLRIKFGDDNIPKGLVAHMHPAQEDAYEQIGFTIAEQVLDGSGKQGFEPFFKVKSMAGVPIKVNIHADPTRIDFLCLDHWGRAVALDIDFYTDPGNGETMFGVYGASQGRAAAVLWYIATSLNVYTSAPSMGAYIKTLAVPTGYTQ